MPLRPASAVGLLIVLATTASPAAAQGVIGFDGIISNRAENAFGAGLTFAYGHPSLTWPWGSNQMALKLFAAADLEIVAGTLTDPQLCRYEEPSGGKFYYRYCNGSLDAVSPELAQGSSPTRAYLALYGVMDFWRVRLGPGTGWLPATGSIVPSAVVGFAASSTSWLMIEKPNLTNGKDWRLRVEVAIAGPEFIW